MMRAAETQDPMDASRSVRCQRRYAAAVRPTHVRPFLFVLPTRRIMSPRARPQIRQSTVSTYRYHGSLRRPSYL